MVKGMPRIAVIGVSGRVGDGLRRFSPEGTEVIGLTHKRAPNREGLAGVIEDFDITDERKVNEIVGSLANSGVRTIINSARPGEGVDVIEAERYSEDPTSLSAFQINGRGAELLAGACAVSAANGKPILLLHLSAETVFGDNVHRRKYTEEAESPVPVDSIGRSGYTDSDDLPTWDGLTQYLGERKVLERYPQGSVVVRMHGVQGPRGSFFARTASEVQKGEPFTRVRDMYVAHLTDATVVKAILAIEEAMHAPETSVRGVYHVSASTACTPYEIALKFADSFSQPRNLITPISLEELIRSSRKAGRSYARRPYYTILDVAKFERDFYRLPTAEASIDEYVDLYGQLFHE